jgi:acyl-CoA thioesterase-1
LFRRHFIRSVLLAAAVGLSAVASHAAAPKVLVVGDSLSAEYGIARGTGWVALLTQKLQADKVPAQVINGSISGDTTAGGRARLPALLKTHQPAVVVIELGSNDALRGLSLPVTEANLTAMTQAAQQAGAKVLLIGMQMPPNYGAAYGKQFSELFAKVAKTSNAALVPFLLKGVADRPDALKLFQADRIHPTAEAHPTILANVYPALRKILP